jgi:hypothetical protein
MANLSALWQGLAALAAGIVVAAMLELVVMLTTMPVYLAGHLWGLFPTLLLFNHRHWGNKVAFGVLYVLLASWVLPHLHLYF